MSLNLGSLLANAARKYSGETAVIFHDRRMAYPELDEAARRFAAELTSRGLGRGEKVAIIVPNSPEFTIAYFGTLYAGGVAVPLSTLHVADELVFQLDDCEAKHIVLDTECAKAGLEAWRRMKSRAGLYLVNAGRMPERPPEAKEFESIVASGACADVAPTRPDETCVILYTSGTTGHPKGAELSHFNLYNNAQYIAERCFSLWPRKINVLGPGHVGIAALPLYHTFGQTNIQNGMLFNGGAVTYLNRFTPGDAAEVIVRDQVTFFAGVPTMYFALLNDPATQNADLSCLQFCVSGGAPMPVEVKKQFQEKFGVKIQEGYGLTETSPLACIQKIDETDRAGTIGKPIDGVEIRIHDDEDREVAAGERGEIVIRGHNVMKGYLKQAEATAHALRNGWFHSGDIGFVGDHGDIYIVDRKKDMILRGGYNVYPREVEEVLYQHPAVREAAVIGVPHDRLGEEVKAVVSLKPGAMATCDEIIAHCKEHVAAYKYPRVVEIIADLPKGPTGKILKRPLRDTNTSK